MATTTTTTTTTTSTTTTTIIPSGDPKLIFIHDEVKKVFKYQKKE